MPIYVLVSHPIPRVKTMKDKGVARSLSSKMSAIHWGRKLLHAYYSHMW